MVKIDLFVWATLQRLLPSALRAQPYTFTNMLCVMTIKITRYAGSVLDGPKHPLTWVVRCVLWVWLGPGVCVGGMARGGAEKGTPCH